MDAITTDLLFAAYDLSSQNNQSSVTYQQETLDTSHIAHIEFYKALNGNRKIYVAANSSETNKASATATQSKSASDTEQRLVRRSKFKVSDITVAWAESDGFFKKNDKLIFKETQGTRGKGHLKQSRRGRSDTSHSLEFDEANSSCTADNICTNFYTLDGHHQLILIEIPVDENQVLNLFSIRYLPSKSMTPPQSDNPGLQFVSHLNGSGGGYSNK